MISGKPKDSSEAFKDRQEREMAADIDRFTSNLGVILEARIYDEGKLKVSHVMQSVQLPTKLLVCNS